MAICEVYDAIEFACISTTFVARVNSGVFQQIFSRKATSVFEMGLGTGTNFLLTAALAEHFAVQLDYWAIEKRLLPISVYQHLELARHLPKALLANSQVQLSSQHFQAISKITDAFTRWIDQNITLQTIPSSIDSQDGTITEVESNIGPFRKETLQLSEYTTFHLLLGDAMSLPKTCTYGGIVERFSAVYFDPFSPETNPELWTKEMLSAMYQLLQKDGRLTSYCVKGNIRRLLQDIGFTVHKIPGPAGGKREVLLALK